MRRSKRAVINLSNKEYEKEVEKSDKVVILDFWASWCGPCRMMSPIIDEIANENKELKVCKVNVDEEQELAKQFNIMSIPTIVVMKDGNVINQVVGVVDKSEVLKMTK